MSLLFQHGNMGHTNGKELRVILDLRFTITLVKRSPDR